MRKVLTFLSKTIAVIFAILFVITAVLVILLFNIERQMFSADLYKSALAEQQVYERLPGIAAELLTTSMTYNPCAQNPLVCEDISPELRACYELTLGNERYATLASGKEKPTEAEMQAIQPCLDQYGNQGGGDQGGMPPFLQNLKAYDWEIIISSILPANELQTIAENILDQMFAYLNGETDSVSVSLVRLKERLTGQAGQDVIRQLIAAQPPCTVEQLAQMAASMLGGGEGMVICAPPEEILALLMPQLQNQLAALVTQVPDKAMIIKPSSQPAQPGGGPLGNDPITAIRTVRLGLRLSPLLPLGLLLLVTLFGVRSLKGWLVWWGIPFFFAGAIALVPGIALLPALNWAWNNFVVPRIPPFLSADVANIGHELATYIIHGLSEQIILQTAILLAVGLAMWVGSYFIKSRAAENTPATPPPPTE